MPNPFSNLVVLPPNPLSEQMNPDDCTGSSRVADPAEVIANEPDYFDQFTMVVATQMAQTPLLALAKVGGGPWRTVVGRWWLFAWRWCIMQISPSVSCLSSPEYSRL